MAKKHRPICDIESVIRDTIEDSAITQVELANRSGVSQGLLSLFLESDLEKRRTITLPVADRLCRALGLRLVRTKKLCKGEKKMSERFYFPKGCNTDRVRELCKHPIRQRRGKMICEQILRELDSGYLTKKTKKWLSKWVNPARREPKVESTFKAMCKELFGHRIARDNDCYAYS
jgi:transcriptional regulator with XRE-family HTH domain